MKIVEELIEDFIRSGDFGKAEALLPDVVKKEMFHPYDLLKFVGW